MAEPIIELKHITKRFPGIIANDDVSLTINKGEIFALLGENGAGKSTLMSILNGIYEPDEGEIFIRGKKETISSPNYAFSLNIGMVYQHFKLVSNFTVTENIIMGVEPRKKLFGFLPSVDLQGSHQAVAELAEEYGFSIDPHAKIEDLNVSQQQRVEILKVLYKKAEILVFDETTAVLTPQEIDDLLEIMRGLKANGKTVIFITHKLEEIKQVADRCGVMRKGKLVAVKDVASVSTQELANFMVGRVVALNVEKKKAVFGKPVLEVNHLSVKNEAGFESLKDVSFTVHAGEIFAVAGVSGNGQNELAEALAGLQKASAGSILLNGKDITTDSVRSRALSGISYIPDDRQTRGLVVDMNITENLCLKNYFLEPYSHNKVLNRSSMEEKADEMILAHDIRSGQGKNTIVRSMSGGNQQKIIIAREIEADSDLMIFMQPTRGVDIGAIENIRRQMIAERDKGKAILLISLELDEVMSCADTIGVIYSGQLLKTAPADSMDEQEIGQYMMGVKRV